MVYQFPMATDDSCELAKAVILVINEIYIAGVRFYRCGVGAIQLESEMFRQSDLFLPDNGNPELMACFDKINNRYGQDTLKLGAQGQSPHWQMKRDFLSPQFTSNWGHIPKIIC